MTEESKTKSIESSPIVELNHGKVQGIIQSIDEEGNKVYSYLGIRYGKAERFQKPKQVEPWTDVYDATSYKDSCPQPIFTEHSFEQYTKMSEDCLYLNVWRPTNESETLRPVMVYIHGGAFVMGTIFSLFTDSKHIAQTGDVVIVSLAYRLGAFGFLYADDEKAPGNLGLHDMILGLQWVRDNAEKFGGNPNQVTLYGCSAGSMAIGSLILSPMTTGLFHRAIMQGGAPNSNFGTVSKYGALEITKDFAQKIDCYSNVTEEMINCLKAKTMNEISEKLSMTFNVTNEFFVPIYGDDFMPKSPIESLRDGLFQSNVDIMYGVARDEGTYFIWKIFPEMAKDDVVITVEKARQSIVHLMNNIFNQTFGDEVASFYLNHLKEPSQDELKLAIAQAWGDYQMVCPTILFGEEYAKHRPNGHYYSYRMMQMFPFLENIPSWIGVGHAQDTIYMFLQSLLKRNIDKQLSNDIIRVMTNFAKTGNPGMMNLNDDTTKWVEAFKNDDNHFTQYMSWNASNYQMIDNYYVKVCNEFWKSRIVQ